MKNNYQRKTFCEPKKGHLTRFSLKLKAFNKNKINLKINKGEKIAIIGRTASGKTTVAELILRMYDISSGQLMIDGMDIKSLNLDALRQDIAYVPQDLFLFSDTIENIEKCLKENRTIQKCPECEKPMNVEDTLINIINFQLGTWSTAYGYMIEINACMHFK